jgi:hypothetical protein
MNEKRNEIQAPVLLKAAEAAEWCRITVGTLNHLRIHGRFAPAIRVGRRCFWTPEGLNEWLESQRESA